MDYRLFQPTYTDRKTGRPRQSDTWNIAFRDHLNRRQTLAASVRERDAHALAGKVMELVRCRRNGEPFGEKLHRWLDSTMPQRLRDRLVAMEIIDPLASSAETPLVAHLDGRKADDGTLAEPGYRQTDRYPRCSAGGGS